MPWPLSVRGFAGADPLDRLSSTARTVLHLSLTAVVTTALVLLITGTHLVAFSAPWLCLLEVLSFTFLVAPLTLAMRRSSSLVPFLFILIPLYALDLYLEGHDRARGIPALWEYPPGTFISAIHPAALRSLLTQSVDGLVLGPLTLWLSRMVAGLAKGFGTAPEPLPFPALWTDEPVGRPPRDFAFWVLRLLGLIYLGYFLLLLLGGLGSEAWPTQIGELFNLTYVNPYLAMNTAAKICLMTALATVGAYNAALRVPTTLALLLGHLTSVAGCLLFWFAAPGTAFHDFLLTSAIVDGVMVVLFAILYFQARKTAAEPGDGELPVQFSLPTQIWRVVLIAGAVYGIAEATTALVLRWAPLPPGRWTSLVAASDPALGNSLTLHVTLAVLCMLMARRQRERDVLVGVILFAFSAATAMGVLLLTCSPLTAAQEPFFFAKLCFFVLSIVLLSSLRTLSFNVEYAVTSFRAPSALAIQGLHSALFPDDARSDTLQSVDRFAGSIRGRKRGLLSFPFWLVERIAPALFGAKPAFSSMSPEERAFFLRDALVRPEAERRRSMIPELADIAYELAVAAQSVILFAAYAGIVRHEKIGYLPPGARERLQGSARPLQPLIVGPSGTGGAVAVAPLPRDENDPRNFPPASSAGLRPLPAPRVSTPISEPGVPGEVDYLVIGSGPGGAVAAYRLACRFPDARIAVLESGGRYSPLQDFNERELEMIAKLYKEGGVQQTRRADMIILQGECVGGGSVVNNAVCFTAPPEVREKWRRDFGLELTGLDAAYAQVERELQIGPLNPSGINGRVSGIFEKAVRGLNASHPTPLLNPAEVVKVSSPHAMGDGLWNLGNRFYGKRTVLETFIPWAEARGVHFVPNCTAVSFETEGRRATCVLVHTLGGTLERISVKKGVCIAGGVISSSHLLMRSKVDVPAGQSLSCNFALPATYEFEDRVDAFDGDQITLGARDVQNRAIFETYFNPPGAFALTLPFFFGRHRSVMDRYPYLLNFGALVGSESLGTLSASADLINGQSFNWELGRTDQQNLIFALETLLALGQHAGAKRVILPTRPGVEFTYASDDPQTFSRALRSRPLRLEDLVINTAHPQGGNPMAAAGSLGASRRVVDERARVIGLDNVYITDASVFPTSLTVNPQWTIMALSTLAANQME